MTTQEMINGLIHRMVHHKVEDGHAMVELSVAELQQLIHIAELYYDMDCNCGTDMIDVGSDPADHLDEGDLDGDPFGDEPTLKLPLTDTALREVFNLGCLHTSTYLNDKDLFTCYDCGKELGR